jgi:membrane protein DedA with SNARE-associated domain
MSFISVTAGLASHNPFLAYAIIYVSTIFLGNISAFVSFWIIAQTNFGFWGFPLLIVTIFCSDFTGDLLWYSLGRKLRGTRFGLWIKNHLPGHARIESMLDRNGKQWLFLSKFIFGSAPPVIFLIGWTGMEFKIFLKNSIYSILLWLPILIGLAYGLISGLSPLNAVADFKEFEWTFVVGLLLFIILDYFAAMGFGALIRKILGRAEREDDPAK